jgi:hypothetical protein
MNALVVNPARGGGAFTVAQVISPLDYDDDCDCTVTQPFRLCCATVLQALATAFVPPTRMNGKMNKFARATPITIPHASVPSLSVKAKIVMTSVNVTASHAKTTVRDWGR